DRGLPARTVHGRVLRVQGLRPLVLRGALGGGARDRAQGLVPLPGAHREPLPRARGHGQDPARERVRRGSFPAGGPGGLPRLAGQSAGRDHGGAQPGHGRARPGHAAPRGAAHGPPPADTGRQLRRRGAVQAERVRAALTAAPMIAIASLVSRTSRKLPWSGLIFTISWSWRLRRVVSTNRAFGPVM